MQYLAFIMAMPDIPIIFWGALITFQLYFLLQLINPSYSLVEFEPDSSLRLDILCNNSSGLKASKSESSTSSRVINLEIIYS